MYVSHIAIVGDIEGQVHMHTWDAQEIQWTLLNPREDEVVAARERKKWERSAASEESNDNVR